MRIKSHKRDQGTSKNIKVMVKSHMMLFDIVEMVERVFASFGLVYFHNKSLILIHDQTKITEHFHDVYFSNNGNSLGKVTINVYWE